VTPRLPPADVTSAVSDALSAVVRFLGRFSVVDWILVGVAVFLLAWAWVRTLAFFRLGTIQINDLTTDDKTLEPTTIKAQLQEELGTRGWVPPSGVPGGSPIVANLANAISEAPVDQAKWLSALIGLIPWPPSSTSFTLSGTLSTKTIHGTNNVGMTYQLARSAPRPGVKFDHAFCPDWPSTIDALSKDIYRKIAESAPEIYPRWARWAKSDALAAYRDGLNTEREIRAGEGEPAEGEERPLARSADGLQRKSEILLTKSDARTSRYEAAFCCFRRASELDPDNMLARLRAANALERIAANLDRTISAETRIDALEAYVSIRIREPTIFEAGFRATVLLAGLAETPPTQARAVARLETVLRRLARAGGRDVDPTRPAARSYAREALAWLRRSLERAVAFVRLEGGPDDVTSQRWLGIRLERAARGELKFARQRLRPLWTIVHERRFRHRFEPTGSERRQLAKALGISRMCLRARKARDDKRLREVPVSDLAQLCWRGWVFCRYMAGRSHVAGWQAHYNAACFYALLPQARPCQAPYAAARLRRRALRHLSRAMDYADEQFSCAYTRDEDPDLETLRKYDSAKFYRLLGRRCPDELTVHLCTDGRGDGWVLHVWGDALTPGAARPWGQPLMPVSTVSKTATFRIRVFDENKPLAILAHRGEEKLAPVWSFAPAEAKAEVWLYPGDAAVHGQSRGSSPDAAGASASEPDPCVREGPARRILSARLPPARS
jgi:hypothetical protein